MRCVKRFGIQEMLSDTSKDQAFLISFLYYFGMLTIDGESEALDLVMRLPNLAARKMIVLATDSCDSVKARHEKIYAA
ncbi:hypothetical protein KKHLCK_07730 [Candidatus Electrothrix laxa]